jgi:tRNA pseudouridine55 synthase
MYRDFKEGEIILINKPYHWTSFDAVNKVRSILKYKMKLGNVKTGHAGTLDPLATGLLIICTGKFTKRIEEMQNYDKEYTGTFTLGSTTPSFDLETEVTVSGDCSNITEEQLTKASEYFTGEFLQLPPVYSARYVEGRRAYSYAREGQEVKLEPRKVSITQFEITKIQLPEVEFRIVCSKGTYIRSVARDMGEFLGCGAYLSSLCRTRIGPFNLETAISPEQFEELIINTYLGESHP